MEDFSLTSDEMSTGQILFLLFMVTVLYALFWFSSQIPANQVVMLGTEGIKIRDFANFFFVIGTFGFGVHVLSFVSKFTGKLDFDTISYSPTWFGGYEPSKFIKLMYIIGCIVVFALTFMYVGTLPQSRIYDAPTFSIIEVGPTGAIILSILAAWVEDFGIIASFIGIFFFASYFITGNVGISLILAVLLTGGTFGGPYHALRYGTSDVLATEKVIMMGTISATLAIIFRNIYLGMAIHGGNNAGLNFFAVYGVTPFHALMTILPWLLLITFIIVGVYIWRNMRGEK